MRGETFCPGNGTFSQKRACLTSKNVAARCSCFMFSQHVPWCVSTLTVRVRANNFFLDRMGKVQSFPTLFPFFGSRPIFRAGKTQKISFLARQAWKRLRRRLNPKWRTNPSDKVRPHLYFLKGSLLTAEILHIATHHSLHTNRDCHQKARMPEIQNNTSNSENRTLEYKFQNIFYNKLFYSCLLSDLALKWQRGWR